MWRSTISEHLHFLFWSRHCQGQLKLSLLRFRYLRRLGLLFPFLFQPEVFHILFCVLVFGPVQNHFLGWPVGPFSLAWGLSQPSSVWNQKSLWQPSLYLRYEFEIKVIVSFVSRWVFVYECCFFLIAHRLICCCCLRGIDLDQVQR